MATPIPVTEVQVGDMLDHPQFNMSRANVTRVLRVTRERQVIEVDGVRVELVPYARLVVIATDNWTHPAVYDITATVGLMDRPDPAAKKPRRRR